MHKNFGHRGENPMHNKTTEHPRFGHEGENPMNEIKDKRLIKIAHYMRGFFKGSNVGTFNLENLLICIYEED